MEISKKLQRYLAAKQQQDNKYAAALAHGDPKEIAYDAYLKAREDFIRMYLALKGFQQ